MAIKATGQITLSCVTDIEAVYRYYLLQSSTLAKPAKPTTFPPASSWDDAEPTYTEGSTNSLYTVECTVFCDDTFAYSEVSLSTSYEAAKTAYNKATNAQNTATDATDKAEQAQSATDGLEERLKAAEATISVLADKIAMLVVGENGETLMEQTEAGWTFNLKEVANNASKASNDIKTVADNLQNISGNVDNLNTSVNELNKFNDYIHIKTENDKPLLELGETTSEFKVKISNTDMRIMEGSDINTEASNEALRSDKTVANKELQVGSDTEGHWVWHKHGAGNLGLVWKESEE